MADEPVATPEPEAQPNPDPAPEPEPHPLEPGGKRFEAVYADMKEARRAADAAMAEVTRLRAEQEAAKQQPRQAPQFYTREQLEAAVAAGQISAVQAADQLAWQRQQETQKNIERQQAEFTKRQAATAEVNTYIQKIPALADTASPEFQRVTRAAWDVAEDMGLPVTDPRVQRRALRETFGAPDHLTAVRTTREFTRTNADTHTETAPGASTAPPSKDPLKAVPAYIMEHWKRRGYSKEEMLAELPYVKARRR